MEQVKDLIENMHMLSVNVRHYFQKKMAELQLDVTYEMVKVLFILSQNKYMNQQQIADITLKNKASLTSMIDNLQKRGLVVRNEDAGDRRNKIITLTAKGKDLVTTIRPAFEEIFTTLYQDVAPDEIVLMNKIVIKMNKAITG